MKNIFWLMLAMLVLASCDREPPIPEVGSVRLEFIPVVGGLDFVPDFRYTNTDDRRFKINFFRMYVSDITLVKEDGTEILVSDVNLFDLAEGGPAKRVQHGNSSYAIYNEIETGSYKGFKFGIGIPDRLNQDPANYGVDHPLSIGNQMYWSWRAGYKMLSIEGFVDSSASKNGILLDFPFVYHTGKDSVTSSNQIYQQVSFLEPDHAFTLGLGQELHFEIDVDVLKIFDGTHLIDMVEENITHSIPGEQFDLSVRMMENVANEALYKRPY